jgi:hypothetical protein
MMQVPFTSGNAAESRALATLVVLAGMKLMVRVNRLLYPMWPTTSPELFRTSSVSASCVMSYDSISGETYPVTTRAPEAS